LARIGRGHWNSESKRHGASFVFRRGADGLSSDFLSGGSQLVCACAFMSTTGVNFDPVLVSQVDWNYNPSSTAPTRSAEKARGVCDSRAQCGASAIGSRPPVARR
jgi:hypothetical protein